jgi:hypothetical protein
MEGSDVYHANWIGGIVLQHRRVLHEALCRTDPPLRPKVLMFDVLFRRNSLADSCHAGRADGDHLQRGLGFEAITALLLGMMLLNESASLSKIGGVASCLLELFFGKREKRRTKTLDRTQRGVS